ncbi:MAG: hypothetical protein F6J93_11300 [Oscillatoria sp. SIO1A7]|nr:hypothetical protein [Oscillatoria sp. SIO1A7]
MKTRNFRSRRAFQLPKAVGNMKFPYTLHSEHPTPPTPDTSGMGQAFS